MFDKLEQILKGSLDSIPSPSPLVKSQIMGRKFSLSCKGKTLLGVVKKLLKTKSLLASPINVLPYYFLVDYLAHVIKTTKFTNSESPIFCLLA